MNRTLAAAVTAILAGTSMWLATVPAYAVPAYARTKPVVAAPATATIRVQTAWTYQGNGRLAVTATCSRRQDSRIIISKMLPAPVDLRRGKNLLIRVTGKTKPGKYAITLWCTPANGRVDALDMTSVKIVKLFPPFKQPRMPGLPKHFKANVTVSSGPPAAKKKAHGEHKHGTKKSAKRH